MRRGVLITPDMQTLPLALSSNLVEGLRELQEAVGGYVEQVHGHGLPNLTAFCNEHGKFRKLPRNELATALFATPPDYIVGNLVVMGPVVNGDVTGLTIEQADIFLSDDPDLLNPLIESRQR